MADQAVATATPAGNQAQQTIDIQAITAAAVKAATDAVNAALPGAVTAAIKPISEQVQTLAQKITTAPTAESVSKAVTETFAAQQTQQTQVNARQEFISQNLKGIPDAFHSMVGNDPAKFAEQAQALRDALKTAGVTVANVGGNASPANTQGRGDPKSVTAAVDTSKLSGIELLRMGVASSSGKAVQPGDSAKATATTPATTITQQPALDAAK